jgi:hypothetical protein
MQRILFLILLSSVSLYSAQKHLSSYYFTNYLEGERVGLKIKEVVANPANTVYLILEPKGDALPEMFVVRWIAPDGTVYDLSLGASYISSKNKNCYFFLGCSDDMPTGRWKIEVFYDKDLEVTLELNVLPDESTPK